MNQKTTLPLFATLALAALAISPLIGMRTIPLPAILHPFSGGVEADIFWRMRVPRTFVAFLAGAGLSLSGMTFQALFRNPLATPFTLGVASGAAFGAAVTVIFGITASLLGIPARTFGALAGALLTIGAVYGLSRTRRGFSSASMLLAGVAVSFFFSSFILFIQYLSDFTESFHIVRWLMGGIESSGYHAVFGLLPFIFAGSTVIFLLSGELNLAATGEDIAASRGVDVQRLRTTLFLAVSVMVGGIVAACGPIGFVGLMAPHISRLLAGANHRRLAPASLLFGGAFLTVCDTIARTVIAPAEIPVGVITSVLGGPFFLWLLLRPSGQTPG